MNREFFKNSERNKEQP